MIDETKETYTSFWYQFINKGRKYGNHLYHSHGCKMERFEQKKTNNLALLVSKRYLKESYWHLPS
jgi:hypothetical protein